MNKMKLVLINSPIQKYSKNYRPKYTTTAPIGLGYLATISSEAGIETKIIDAEAEKLTVGEITEKVNTFSPEVVGINMFSTNYQISSEILSKIDVPFKIVGGPHATLKAETIDRGYIVVRGEAENIFLDVLHEKPKGIVNGGVIENLDELPFIDRSLFCNDPYKINGKIEAVLSTARGCYHQCVFCAVPIINGKKIRSRSIENIINEIIRLNEQGVTSIHFIDDVFNYDKKKVNEFCDQVIEKGVNIYWRALCRVDFLEDSLLEKMKESGCYKLAFGLESGSQNVLKYIRKSSDLEKVRLVINKCKELGIKTKAFFTIGYPNETEEEIRRTLDFSISLNLDEARFMVVRAFPGTKLYEDVKKRGMTDEELDNYRQSRGKNSRTKYHVMNAKSLNGLPSEILDEYINKAYRMFYEQKGRGVC